MNSRFNQDIINSIADPIMIVSADQSIMFVNDSFLSLYRTSRQETIGKKCFSFLHHQNSPCQLCEGECPFQKVFASDQPVTVVHRHFDSNNKEITCEITAMPLHDNSGKIISMIEVMRDVTEGRQLQEATRQSSEFLASVLEGIGEGVVVMDRDYRILAANKGYLNQVRQDWDDVIGRHCFEVSHHFTSHCSDHDHHCPVRAVFESRSAAQAIHTHYDDKNEKVFVECRAYPILDSSGSVVKAIETINDVTARVCLEQKLKVSEEKYRDLYDNAPDGYYSLADNGLIVQVNRTFLEMMGYRREEVVGVLFIEDLLSKESIDICHARFPQFKQAGKMMNIELTMVRKDASLLPVTMNATAVFDADGKFVMSRSVIRDISDRRIADEEKKKLQEQLFQSQKLEALGTLAGGIAHDFNNLLASILGYASLAKSDLPTTDPVYQHVSIIERASLRASELTQQLLGFAKGGKYEPKPNDINEIVREVATLLSRTIEKNITIEEIVAPGIRPALCDAGQIQQAILNICINARDAMPEGGKITIATRNVHLDIKDVQFFVDVAPGDYVVIKITDSGIGMDRETREHIFDPFFTTKVKGTGLGLSLVYGIIRKHNGFIQIDSEPGKGSSFTVHLPACMSQEVCSGTKETVSLRRGSETILVVDDEPMITDLAREILRRHGYKVLTAASGEEALQMYEQKSGEIAAVILDVIMPGMDGTALFRNLKKLNPEVKVIASSGYTHDREADDMLMQQSSGFVQKPYRITELVKVVGDVVMRNS